VVGAGHHATGGGAHAGHGLPVVLLLAAAALVFTFASAAVALRRRLPPLPRAEAALGAASIALMTLPLLTA